MEEIFVDSNVFLRFYAEDDEAQGEAAEKMFCTGVERKIDLITGPPVFFEVAWSLKKGFNWPNHKILEALEAMTAIPNMKILDRDLVVGAIMLAKETGQGFPDAYIAATARSRAAKVATFNKKHFSKLGVKLHPLEEL
ncbi:MAG: PIN domain-containing protein [Synergistaceae bacterium]|nr:PIN domain-containing protein [Synergistaceae bacterium]